MKIYMLVDCTKYELPLDVSLSLKKLADKWNIPYQTARNARSDNRKICYLNARIEVVNVPVKETLS